MWKLILAQLITKNPGVSKVVLELLAKKLADKVTAEDQIEGAISEFEANSLLTVKEYADFVQKEGDSRVGDAKKKWELDNKKTDPNNPDPEKKDDNIDDTIPDWAKALQASVSSLATQVAGTKNEATMSDLIAKAKEKNIPEAYVRKHSIGDDFDIEKTLTELETGWGELSQIALNHTVAGEKVIPGVKTTGTQVTSAITNFAKANVDAANATKK